MYGSYMHLIYSKYLLFYESSTNLGYFAHIQTVCTRPLLGGEGRGGKLGTSLVHCKPSSQCTCHYVPSPGLPHPPGNTGGNINAEWEAAKESLWEHQRNQSVQQVSTCTMYYSPTSIIRTSIIWTLQIFPMHDISSNNLTSIIWSREYPNIFACSELV